MHRRIFKTLVLAFLLQYASAGKPKSEDLTSSPSTKADAATRLLHAAGRPQNNRRNLPRAANKTKPQVHKVEIDKYDDDLRMSAIEQGGSHVILEARNEPEATAPVRFVENPKELLDKISTPDANLKNGKEFATWKTKTPGFVKSETLRAVTRNEVFQLKPKRRTGRPQNRLQLKQNDY